MALSRSMGDRGSWSSRRPARVARARAARGSGRPASAAPAFDAAAAARFADLALACVHQEYPNKIAHVLSGDGDVKPPRELTPAFYGCYDWHSSVHGHWLLVRLARTLPGRAVRAEGQAGRGAEPDARAHRRGSAVPHRRGPRELRAAVRAGVAAAAGRRAAGLEGPARRSSGPRRSAPLEAAAVARLKDWLPKLSRPIRIGEHDQTAFSFGLILDWARTAGDRADDRSDAGQDRRVLREGPRLPDRLRAVGPGLPLAVPGRGRSRCAAS